MNSTENGVAPSGRATHGETLDARLTKGRPLLDQEVRVTIVESADHEEWIGVKGRLLQVDANDPTLPFLVDVPRAPVPGGLWVHAVEPVLADPEAPFKVGDRVDLASIPLGMTTQAGTVIRVYAVDGISLVHIVWDGSLDRIGPSGTMTEYADDWTAGRLRPLTEEEQASHPTPAPMLRWLKENAPMLERDARIAGLERRLLEEIGQRRLAEGRVSRADRDLEALKKTVGRVAMKYARRHEWCSVVKDALEEMGLEPPVTKVRATATVTYEIEGEVDDVANVNESWIRDSLLIDDPRLDGDWSNQSIERAGVSIAKWSVVEDD